jgi:hypothetical protein
MRFARAFQLAIVLSSLVLLGGPVLADLPAGSTGGVHTRPTPRPTPKPRPQPIPVPTGLTNTRDPQVCGTHAGPIAALLCAGAYTGGSLVLVFNWNGDAAYPTPDGFNIYEVDNGLHKLVDRNTTQATVGIVKRPAGGFRNRCYTVTAVVGKLQSKPSRWACLAAGAVGPFTTVIVSNPSAVRMHTHEYENYSPHTTIGPGFNCSNATPCVGGLYLYETCCPLSTTKTVTETIANYYRAYFHFKLDPGLKKQYLIKATLSDNTTKTAPGSSFEYCLNEIAPAASDWMSEPAGSTDIVGGPFTLVDGSSLKYGLDVRSIVNSWINGSKPNYGFVLRGKLEASSYNTEPAIYCVLQLDKNAKLSIVHS